jgi:ATP-dependent DNA helicase RecG
MKESHRVELKLSLTDSLEKEVVAFLNSREGGFIFLGIDDQGGVQGVDNSDSLQLQIKDRIKNNIHPTCMGLFDIIGEELNEKDIIKIIIASGPEKPYYLKKQGMSEKGCFIRVGTAAEPMPTRMIENLFSRRTRNSIGKIRSNQQKLKFEQLKIYYEASGKPLNSKFASNLGLQTEDNQFNYVAYLMSDINTMSFKVAKYKGKNRVHLIENNEYGFCSIIKAVKQILDKFELENRTKTQITSKERIDTRLWNAIALREAIINAIVHNDYSNEVSPKFEIFDDRLEITSAGTLPDTLSKEEFFEGFSLPRNQEIMRIFRDIELVEQLGSGIPRILETYSKECFKFTDNFLRMTFPTAWDINEDNTPQVTPQLTPQVTPQLTPQVEQLLKIIIGDLTRDQLQLKLNLKDREYFRKNYILEALSLELIEMTIPDKPNSRLQKYRLTEKGKILQKQLVD